MSAIILVADGEGRITLPEFASATFILEAISANEYRLRKVEAIPADAVRFPEEEMPVPLSERDALRLLEALENPPAPNEAARRAAERFTKQYD